MTFCSIRKLPSRIELLFDESNTIPKFTYFNPSSSYPYIYVRATEAVENMEGFGLVNINHVFIYSYITNKMTMIDIPFGSLKLSYNVHQGIEDTRLFMYKGRLWFISSSTHASSSMLSEMLIGYYDDSISSIEFIQHLDFGIRPLKNMCPFVCKDRIYTIDFYSLKVYEIVLEETEHGDTFVPVCRGTLAPYGGVNKHMLRGSTSPIHLHGNLWGCVVHEHVSKLPKGAFAYVSYWLEFDMERSTITFLSDPFYVSILGIEFISGIEYFRDRDVIELYLGVKDKKPIVAHTTLHDLRTGL